MTFDRTVRTGAEVYTGDGTRLGTVTEVRGGAFRISTGLLPDYWLPMSAAAFADDRALRLEFAMHELGPRLIPPPPIED